MWISKKELKALRQKNDARHQHINVLESQVVEQKHTINRLTNEISWLKTFVVSQGEVIDEDYGALLTLKRQLDGANRAKQQAVANFHNAREHNSELQE